VLEIRGLESFRAAVDAAWKRLSAWDRHPGDLRPSPRSAPTPKLKRFALSWSERRPRSWHASWL
jgi:hypothetical protein